jgi:hypothetical protein
LSTSASTIEARVAALLAAAVQELLLASRAASRLARVSADRISAVVAPGVTLKTARAKRVYVAGPMTGLKDFNYPAFNAAADQLRALGYQVENPADHGIVPGAEWADYMAYDLTRLGVCGMIALLPGWERSEGAKLEVQIGHRLGMTIVNAHDLVSMEIAG